MIVGCFTKMVHFIKLKTQFPIQDLARTFLQAIQRLHGLPEETSSDKDFEFDVRYLECLVKLLNVNVCMSTAYHPRSDGQTERVKQTLQHYLRNYWSYQEDDWFDLLSMAKLAYNSATSKSSTASPFDANYGYQPQTCWPAPERKRYNFDPTS